MILTYLEQRLSRYTFEMPLVKKWVEDHCRGRVLNLFAGKVRLNVTETRVDIDPNVEPDYCMDAEAFIEYAIDHRMQFDTVVFDPPFSLRKAKEKYNGRYSSSVKRVKDKLPLILSENAHVLCFGYETTGMGKRRGFIKKEIVVINHAGDYDDIVGMYDGYKGKSYTLIVDNGPINQGGLNE